MLLKYAIMRGYFLHIQEPESTSKMLKNENTGLRFPSKTAKAQDMQK
jgi:hypothetical protein